MKRRLGTMKHDAIQYILFICLIILCGILLAVTNADIHQKTIDQMQKEQMVHANQAKSTVTAFFQKYYASMKYLATLDHISVNDEAAEGMMRAFYLTHEPDISSITRMNARGIITFSYPNESIIGTNISQQTHVQEVLTTHQPVISDIFTAVQGYQAVAYHIPVFSGERFEGTIGLLFPFDTLAQESLEQIRIMETGYAFAISKNGVILYSPYEDQIGRSVQDVFAGSPAAGTTIFSALSGDSGTGSYWFDPDPGSGKSVQKYYVSWQPVQIGNQFWTIFIATPEQEIFSSLQVFTRDIAIIAVIFIITLLMFAYYYARERGIAREEEKRKQVESALRRSEEDYRTIIETMQDVFYRSDRDGNLIMMSPSGLSMFGYASFDEVKGKNIAQTFYFNPEDRYPLLKTLETSGVITNYPITLKTKTGTIVHGQTSSHYYYSNEREVLGVEGIFRDNTSEKMTNAALKQALKKLTLLTSITLGDIQNYMFVLSGYLEILKSTAIDPEQQEILSKEEMLARSITSALTFAKDYQGLGTKPPVWQNVEQAFLFGISHVDLSSFSRSIDIRGIEVFADPLFEKVFYILADNLLRHAPGADTVSISWHETKDGLVITFEDNGPGIAPDEKERIFERGYGPHNGNGLFLAREILSITDISIRECGDFGSYARFDLAVPPGVYRFITAEE